MNTGKKTLPKVGRKNIFYNRSGAIKALREIFLFSVNSETPYKIRVK
jgi:hypothetical protein